MLKRRRLRVAVRVVAVLALAFALSGGIELVTELAHAGGAKDDVSDTDYRLARLYRETGLRRAITARKRRAQRQGCNRQVSSGAVSPRSSRPGFPRWLGWLMLAVVVAALLTPMVVSALRERRRRRVKDIDSPDLERGEMLPREWRVTFRGCRTLADAGKIDQALAALHRLCVVSLARRGVLTVDVATTNWAYVRALAVASPERETLSAVTLAAEQVVLGNHQPRLADYDALERAVSNLSRTSV